MGTCHSGTSPARRTRRRRSTRADASAQIWCVASFYFRTGNWNDVTSCFVCSQACVVPIESFLSGPAWTPSGAGFKLGRKPLAIYRASTSIDFLSSDTSGFDRTYLPTGTFHAVNGEERSERGKYVGGG